MIPKILFMAVLLVATTFAEPIDLIALDNGPVQLVVVHKPKEPEKPKAPTPLESLNKWSTYYGVSQEQMRGTIQCESQFNPNAHNKSDPQGGAMGISQFLPPTFKRMSEEAGLTLNVWNADDSIHLMAFAFSKGYQRQWTCWRNIYGKM